MAEKVARDSAIAPGIVTIAAAQTGNGNTTDYADRGPWSKRNGTVVRIITGVGATPTCTYQIQVSADASTWVNATYADIGTPTSDSTATFAITTNTVAQKIVKHAQAWRYIRVVFSANTNVTNTVDIVFNDYKAYV